MDYEEASKYIRNLNYSPDAVACKDYVSKSDKTMFVEVPFSL